MKAKRPSSALAMSGNNMDALSSMKEMVVEETLDKKTALAVKNRENAFKARQTTKEKIQKLNDQNTNLQKEVRSKSHTHTYKHKAFAHPSTPRLPQTTTIHDDNGPHPPHRRTKNYRRPVLTQLFPFFSTIVLMYRWLTSNRRTRRSRRRTNS